MMNIILTGLVAGLTVAVALLARDRNRYYTISNETIEELAILEKEYDELDAMILEAGAEIMALEEDRDYWMNMAVEMTDRYIDELDDEHFSIKVYVGSNRLQYACDMLTIADDIVSPITEDMQELYVTDLDEETINKLAVIRDLMFKQIETNDKYYYDLFFETGVALNSLLDEVGR